MSDILKRMLVCALVAGLAGCAEQQNKGATVEALPSVGVVKLATKPLERQLTLSSELVPFQEIDVYAKESGYVRQLNVDYGSRVSAGQLLAVLEIPELEVQLRQDDAAIKNASDQVSQVQHEIGRVEAQHQVVHLQYQRLEGVAKSKPGLVAQQEVDEVHGKDLAAEAQVEVMKSSLQSASSQLIAAQAKRQHDKVLFDYTRITAPFAGIVTQRFANLGALMQAGTNSSTQAMPLVRLSQDSVFRLVIPVPESYVHFIHVGDPVSVLVSSLNKTVTGKIARFAVDVKSDTRTMHTEVDVPNPNRELLPGLYAQATLQLEKKDKALAVPLQAVTQNGDRSTVFVVGAGNKIESRLVKLGIQTENDAEVLDGLKEGELVVISDRSSLKAGEEVRPKAIEVIEYAGRGAK